MQARSTRSLVLQRRFTNVYRKELWGPLKSGPGSGRRVTRPVREAVRSVMENLFPAGSSVSFTDAPCGDMTWMPLLLNELTTESGFAIQYTGIDIVEELVHANRSSMEDTPGLSYRFIHRDLTEKSPSRSDIIFCKDLVNHLCFDDICRILAGFNESGSTYLLISSNRGHRNLDAKLMRGNQSRHIDLEGPPFLLQPPRWSDGYLALWRLPVPLDSRATPHPEPGCVS